MIVDNIKQYEGEKKGVMVGGNWVTAYRGFDSYIIGKILDDSISSISYINKLIDDSIPVNRCFGCDLVVRFGPGSMGVGVQN